MTVTDPRGFRAAGVAAGLKESGHPDVAVVLNDGPSCAAAGVFTSNRVKAAPVLWSQQVVAGGQVRAVVLNSGGANACTGPAGFADTHQTAEHLAAVLSAGAAEPSPSGADATGTSDAKAAGGAEGGGAGADWAEGGGTGAGGTGAGGTGAGGTGIGEVAAGEIAVCSTGLIGDRLPLDRLLAGVDAAVAAASGGGGLAAADAIRTTDTVPKTCSVAGPDYVVGGMAKGAAMLAPALATMLVVLTTDAELSADQLDTPLRSAVRETFDRLDTDGCMSTNDTVLLLASGASGVRPDPGKFAGLVTQACADLARQMQDDAEGASKSIAIEVTGAASEADAVEVGRAVARCNLLKCAIHGADPNWGRVLAAVGTTSAAFEADQLSVAMNGVWVCKDGAGAADRSAVDLSAREVTITVDLAAGQHAATIWTTDLTAQYVHENSAYST
jgi:glutamate N-acetyltransferase / amino-acid N-acetyltransferase